jgi:hypothetical protein
VMEHAVPDETLSAYVLQVCPLLSQQATGNADRERLRELNLI